MPKPTCCIQDCQSKVVGKFLCSKHYTRLRNTGTTSPRPKSTRVCKMPKCDRAHFQHGWCSMHFQRIANSGSPFDKDQKWTIEDYDSCVVCGEPTKPGSGLRRYCGNACAIFASKGRLEKSKPCAVCGSPIDLHEIRESGSRPRRDILRCKECRRGVNLRAFVPKIAIAKGTDCGVCSEPIDMGLKYPDPMSRSVDHIFPKSLGGTEDMSNLQLAHLNCNVRKNNRLDYVAS